MAETEVEYIGKISKDNFQNLKELFEKKGVFQKKKSRISFMYFRDRIPKDLEEIKFEETDLRIRFTNKKSELVLKHGQFNAAHARKEISILFDQEETEKYIALLNCLGWYLGVIYATETFVYKYEEVEFSLIEIKDYGYNFEAEILTEEKKIKEARQKITTVLKNLDLREMNKEELNIQCNSINNKKDLQFNFRETPFSKIKIRFKDMINENL